MNFTIGLLLGVGVGGVVSFLIMLYAVHRALSMKESNTSKIEEYWDVSTKQQLEQIHMLDRIATVMEYNRQDP